MVTPGTVAEAMLRRPTLHPATLTVGEARAAFDRSAKTHLLLLVSGGVLVTTLTRTDLTGDLDPAAPAASVGTLAGRTTGPDAQLAPTWDAMTRSGQRRLAVVDATMALQGLLCLKSSLRGFCADEGVATMRRERSAHSQG